MDPPFNAPVVANHTTTPATNPATLPTMHPHLFALDQVTASAMGTTAEPSITPMNSCTEFKPLDFQRKIEAHVKPTHGHSNVEEDDSCERHTDTEKCDLLNFQNRFKEVTLERTMAWPTFRI